MHPSESLKVLIARLKKANAGKPMIKKMTDEDGDFMTGGAMDWIVLPDGEASPTLSPPHRTAATPMMHMEELDQVAEAAGGEAVSASPSSTEPLSG